MSNPDTRPASPQRAAMLDLKARGFAVREVWMGDYYEGLSATKKVGEQTIEIYAGNADDGEHGEHGDLHYEPVVYIDDVALACRVETIKKAERVAEFRALMLRSARVSA